MVIPQQSVRESARFRGRCFKKCTAGTLQQSKVMFIRLSRQRYLSLSIGACSCFRNQMEGELSTDALLVSCGHQDNDFTAFRFLAVVPVSYKRGQTLKQFPAVFGAESWSGRWDRDIKWRLHSFLFEHGRLAASFAALGMYVFFESQTR